MKITNLNPDTAIGATAWFVEMEGHRLLMDAGTHPRMEGRAGLPRYDLVKQQELDAIAISHCHHDHVGSLPVAMRHFPHAHVLMTELSYFLVERVLHNSVNVMKRQRDELGLKDYPLYSHDEVDEIAARFQGFKYNREVDWASFHKSRAGFLSPTLEFCDAGHTLGSAGIMVRGQRETLFYTGDVCFQDQTILRGARFEDVKADVLVMETTRGNRERPPASNRQTELARLSEAIERVLARKGSVLIPAFALGRTQEILAHRQYPSLQLREALNLVVLEHGQAEKMKLTGSHIFVITAGMMSEHTAAHTLATRMMGNERHAIFFVGYADPDTPGGHLKAAPKGKPFILSPSGGEVTRHCEMEDFDLTAHADRTDLLDFVGEVEPRTVLLSHGDEDSRDWFAREIHARHPKIKIIQPKSGEAVEV